VLRKNYRHTAVFITADIISVNDCLEHLYTAVASEVKDRRIPEEISTKILSFRRKTLALRKNGKNLVKGRILNTKFITECPWPSENFAEVKCNSCKLNLI